MMWILAFVLGLNSSEFEVTAESMSTSIESACIGIADQGVFRPPWFADQPTLDFETVGCCYNDGLKEPGGC